MLKTLQNAFKVKDVRHRIFYVLMMLVVIRIGSQLPVPGVDGVISKPGLKVRRAMHLTSSTHLQAVHFADVYLCTTLHLLSHHPLLSSFLQSRFQNWKKCREKEKMAERNLVQLPLCNHRIIPV